MSSYSIPRIYTISLLFLLWQQYFSCCLTRELLPDAFLKKGNDVISAFPTARSAVLLINSLWYRSHTCIWICSSINKGVPEVLCYPETYQALHVWMPGLLLNLYSELSFTASLYKGQVSNPRISWVKQPSGCCTSSLAILYQTFGILFSKFIFNFQNFYYQISGISWMSNRFRTPKMLSCCCSLLFHIHAQPTLIPRDLRGAGKVERADVAQLW